jgi:hypothetical protein
MKLHVSSKRYAGLSFDVINVNPVSFYVCGLYLPFTNYDYEANVHSGLVIYLSDVSYVGFPSQAKHLNHAYFSNQSVKVT